MKKVLKILVKIGLIAAFLLAFSVVSLQLFAPEVYRDWNESLRSFYAGDVEVEQTDVKNIVKIAYPYRMPSNLEVTAFNPQWRAILLNIYDPIVKIDRNLQIQPGVAVSWGRIDELTWEFRIRPGVKFHDQRTVSVDDVVTSIKRAQNYSGSELRTMLANVQQVTKQDATRFRVKTKQPDPLLLNRLATVLVFPENFNSFENEAMGTGPYQLMSMSAEEGILLSRNELYWGEKSEFEQARILFMDDHQQRMMALIDKQVDLVVNVPPGAIKALEEKGIEVIDRPNLQVNFLLFNFDNEFLGRKPVRDILRKVFDKAKFVELTNGFARPVEQFVSNGVFGFSPNVEPVMFDLEGARDVIREESDFEKPRITFHMIDGLQKFGEYIVTQLTLVGIGVDIEYLSQEKINESLQFGNADLYFLGWRSELGDASDFLRSIAHSRDDTHAYGLYNGINYINDNVDELIEQSDVNLSVEERKKQLQQVMEILVQDDVIGIPLYESEVIYGFWPEIVFEPRVDGYVLINQLSFKKN